MTTVNQISDANITPPPPPQSTAAGGKLKAPKTVRPGEPPKTKETPAGVFFCMLL